MVPSCWLVKRALVAIAMLEEITDSSTSSSDSESSRRRLEVLAAFLAFRVTFPILWFSFCEHPDCSADESTDRSWEGEREREGEGRDEREDDREEEQEIRFFLYFLSTCEGGGLWRWRLLDRSVDASLSPSDCSSLSSNCLLRNEKRRVSLGKSIL